VSASIVSQSAGAGGRRLVAPVLAAEQAGVEREERQQAEPELLTGRHHLGLDLALEQAVPVLRADERGQVAGPGGPVGVGDLPTGEVGVAQVAHLARADQVVEGGQRLLDRGGRVGLVQLVEVEVVGLEPAQRGLDRAHDVPPGAAGAEVVAVDPLHVHAELGGQHDVVAPALEGGAEQLLRGAVRGAVDVRGVEQRYPGVERRIDDLAGAVRVELAAEVVAADADNGHDQARRTQSAVAHLCHRPTLCPFGTRFARGRSTSVPIY
jgi:hypothetical protein